MNFAAAGGITRYHTALDNADLLDQRTLQHQGIVRALDGAPVRLDRSERSAHRRRRGFLRRRWIVDSLLGAAGDPACDPRDASSFLGVIWIGIRDGRFSVGGIAAGFAIYAIAIAVAIVEARGVWWLMAALAGWRMLPVGTTYGGFYFSVAADALIFGTLWIAYELIGRRFRLQNLGAGALVALDIHDARDQHRDARRQLHFHVAAAVRDARDRLSLACDRRAALRSVSRFSPWSHWRRQLRCSRRHSPQAPTARCSSSYFRGLTAVLLFGLFIPYIDFLTAGRRWIVPAVLGAARDRHDHQRQRGQ